MEHTQEVQQQTDSGAEHGQQAMRVSLPSIPDACFGVESDPGGFDAMDGALLRCVQTLVPLTGEGLDHWTREERRIFLNWCLDEGVLTIQDGRLIPIEECVPTAPLTHDTDADAPNNAEDAGFLRDVERATPVIASNPAISAKELADALGMNSAVYAQTLKVSVNAHKSAEEGAE